MKYDFDKIIDRHNTGAIKLEFLPTLFGRKDLIPLWVADMDFETPDFIIDAIRQRTEHPIFGYTAEPDEYWLTVKEWIRNHHQWNVKAKWLTYIPGIVRGIAFAINALTQPGDKVIIQTPVYHPFRIVTEGNNRVIVENPLLETSGDSYYQMDFDHLLTVIDDAKMLILCNPHNPAGIVWSRETLTRLANICFEHNVIVISDEIHADLAIFGHKHIPFASVSPESEHISITFQAPTKTFNMAGIVSSYAILPNDSLREKFYGWLEANELNAPNMFAPLATIAAYRHGEEWRCQMLRYIEENILYVENWFATNIPDIKTIRPQASFLIWLDCRNLGYDHNSLLDLFINRAHLALNDGVMFGSEPGFMRLNVGCPRGILNQALSQLLSGLAY